MNIKDIAKKAGVSPATVSYVLNGKNKTSLATKEKILAIIKEEGYEFNGAARDLKKQKSQIIAICLESLHGSFFNELIDGIEERAIGRNYSFIVATSYGEEKSSAYKILNERRVDGAIILAPRLSDEFLLSIADKNISLVTLDRQLDHPRICNILLNNRSGIHAAVRHLKAAGINRIGYVNGIENHYDTIERQTAFNEALVINSLKYDDSIMFPGSFDQESGIAAGLKLLKLPQLPEAMLCANDETAIGLIHVLQEAGIKIPEQISIIGFDDIILSRYIQPTLSTISHPKQELGVLAVDSLLALIAKQFVDDQILTTHFISRHSSR